VTSSKSRHPLLTQQRDDDVTDGRAKRRRLLAEHQAKMAAKRSESAEAIQEARAHVNAGEGFPIGLEK
jgi:hypothetical protein